MAESITRAVGDFPYRYPVVDVDTYYLWAKPLPATYPYYYDPFWYDPWYARRWYITTATSASAATTTAVIGDRMMVSRLLIAVIVVLQFAACSTTPPLDTRGIDQRITTRQAVATPDALRGRKILWTGVIVQGGNQVDSTQLEVLAYPLRNNNRPDTDAAPIGRFIIVQHGYLETVDYAPGRTLTVVGTLDGLRHGKVGEADYDYPVVLAQQLRLWRVARSTTTIRNFISGSVFSSTEEPAVTADGDGTAGIAPGVSR